MFGRRETAVAGVLLLISLVIGTHDAILRAISPILSAQNVVAQKVAPLTLQQIRQLLSIKAPDATIARELESRGPSFAVDERIVAELARLGAGARTLRILRAAAATGTLVVTSVPGQAQVFVDGVAVGSTDAAGTLRVQAKPGAHEVIVKKPRFRDGFSTRTTIAPSAEVSVAVALEWAVGFVSLKAPGVGTVAEIDGVGHVDPSQLKIDVPPGPHVATLTGPQIQTAQARFEVVAGQDVSVDVPVQVNPEYAASAVAEADSALAAGRGQRSLEIVSAVLSISPSHPGANRAFALGSFAVNRFADFSDYAVTAVHGGERLTLELIHHHGALASAHKVQISVSPDGFSFTPPAGVTCSFRPFTAPFSDIQSNSPTRKSGAVYLELKLKDPNNAKKSLTINLADASARPTAVQKTTAGGLVGFTRQELVGRPESGEALQAISELIARSSRGE